MAEPLLVEGAHIEGDLRLVVAREHDSGDERHRLGPEPAGELGVARTLAAGGERQPAEALEPACHEGDRRARHLAAERAVRVLAEVADRGGEAVEIEDHLPLEPGRRILPGEPIGGRVEGPHRHPAQGREGTALGLHHRAQADRRVDPLGAVELERFRHGQPAAECGIGEARRGRREPAAADCRQQRRRQAARHRRFSE